MVDADEAHLVAERVTRAPWPAIEPSIEALRASNRDAGPRHPMQDGRLLALRVVPHEHAVGRLPDARLACKVIPAPHAQRRRPIL